MILIFVAGLIAMLLKRCGQDKAFKEVSVLADMNPESVS